MTPVVVFSLLANENRLLILRNLMVTDELSVDALANTVNLSQSALSQHLMKLRAENIVATRREGRAIFYRIARNKRGRYMTHLLKQAFTK